MAVRAKPSVTKEDLKLLDQKKKKLDQINAAEKKGYDLQSSKRKVTKEIADLDKKIATEGKRQKKVIDGLVKDKKEQVRHKKFACINLLMP